ncbi:GNAT family N-acetyltransferase [Cuneatibacter caecimuris]|uniref:AraC-like DNA-binding protein n=1 Tax=Cuneatibacter caecimuris TaxID=1796618 RepID=A0A4Q7PQB2_9FIRM|nr:GNAT family N-acetyltransferase [Cuneatibacter caecimuris]RZT02198.1 AraC-like DNA-binding protein [Cuneatibacter caecimuris]
MVNKVEIIKTAIDYIENNLSEKISLSTIATAVGYSKYHLHRIFVETVGLSIHNYVQRRQLTESAKLLVFSDKSILEISLIAGYQSQQAFTNIFKQMYKKTPNEYRLCEVFYPLQLRFDLEHTVTEELLQQEMQAEIRFAKLTDIPAWLSLVDLVIDGFPNLNSADYLRELKKSIAEQRALILEKNKIALAVMSINYHSGSIDFFGVHPLYRQCGIANLFLNKVMNELLTDKDISITTFREGDKADTGYRKFYKELGFSEAELLVEFGYPTQKFIFSPKTGGNINE